MFIRTESFSQYIRLYPVVTFFLALNILIYLMTITSVIGIQVFSTAMGINLSHLRWRMVAFFTPMFLHGGYYAYVV